MPEERRETNKAKFDTRHEGSHALDPTGINRGDAGRLGVRSVPPGDQAIYGVESLNSTHATWSSHYGSDPVTR